SLSYSQYADLSSKTDGFRDIDALSGYINVYGTDINSKSQLKLFLELKKLRAQVNPAALFFQEQTLRETITFCLANSQEENEISFLNAFFPFLKQYLSSSLTAKDEKYFKEKFKLFNETYAKYAALNHLSLLSESFAFLNDYYDTNNKRNEIFFENINKYTPLISGKSSEALHAGDLPAGSLPAAEILSNAKEIIIVVSGGYHTEAVVGMLDLKKISNMTITPNISSNGIEPAKANYKRIISDQGRFFKDALAPAAEPVKQAFEVFAILLDLKAKGHLSDAEYEYSIKTLSERLKETSENKMFLGAQTVVDMIKDMDFNEENLNLIAQNFNVFFGEREVKVNIQGDKAQIIFPNGQSIALEKSENGKIINEQVLEQGVEQDSKIELPSVFNADLFLNTVRAVLSKSFDLSSFTDINNEQTYQTLKNIFAVSVLQYGANLGCDGAIPEIEQNYRGQTIDGIPYELIGKMPVFFQKAALEKQEQAETDLSVLDKAQPQSKPPQVSKFGLFTRSLITFTRVFLIAVLLFSAVKSFSQNVPQDFPASPGAPKMEEVISQKQMSTEWYIRQVANEFMQGNPLPKSFIEAVGVTNAQSGIVNQGVIAYDAAVLLKALALYPRQNRNLVLKMLNAFSRPQIRSNSGFTFDGTKPGKYIYKIIGVDPAVNDGLVKDQYLPGTGENAWVGSALANLLEVYKDDAEIRKKALPLLIDIADGIIALQTQEGFIRMAPKDVVNSYSYLGVDYYNTVSTENNISCFQVIKYVANLKKRAEKQKYETALEKLTNAIFSMYDHNAGYFYTGKDLVSGKVNKQFATDCQTWPILAFSPKIIDNRLGAGTSVKLLMKTLDKSGVKGKVGIIGFDFSDRAQIVSYEWTFGWLLAARAVAKQNPDLSRAEGIRFQKALYSISRYMRESESAKGLYNYADAPGDTGFGWTIVMAKSLASSAWSIFYKLGLNPFDIHYGTFSKPVFPKSVLVGTAVRDTSSIVLIEETKPRKVLLVDKNILYYKGDNWASLVFTQASGRVIEDGDSIKIEYSFISPYNKSSNTSNLPNFLIRVKERGTSKIIFFTNSPEVAEHKKGAILMEKDAKHRQWVAQVPAGLQPMEIDEFAVDYGNQTIYYNMVLNPSNDNDIYFIELTLDGNRPYRHPWEKEFFPFLIFGIGTSFTSFGRTIKRFFGGSKGVVNTHVNIVGVNSMNFNRARELFAGARKTVSEGEVSLPVYVADAQLMSENLSLFQNSGVKIDGESVFFANIDGSLVFAAQNKTVGEITQRLLSGKLKELAGKTLEQEGISFDDISLDALICEFT
ncbi:MAG: hypothetical protein LBU09_01900, partial [Endomicrobium sp.]|nr:hypothetical protein [Endomicrobium sp.]